MKKIATLLLILACAGSLLANLLLHSKAAAYPHLIAVSWGDSSYSSALYGAYVFYESDNDQLQVRARIYIGRPTLWQSYQHDTIKLGRVGSGTEAVAKWGRITWSPDGVRFGIGEDSVLVRRFDLERHR